MIAEQMRRLGHKKHKSHKHYLVVLEIRKNYTAPLLRQYHNKYHVLQKGIDHVQKKFSLSRSRIVSNFCAGSVKRNQ